jgi:hypothetical protein
MEEIKYITVKLANVEVIFIKDELKAFFNAIAPLVSGECKLNGTFYKFVKNIEHANYPEQLNLTLHGTRLETGKELAENQGIKFE